MRQIVFSGINLFSGGTLTIYREMIKSLLEKKLDLRYEIVCFVHSKELFVDFEKKVKLIEINDSRKSYIKRLYYENIYFKKYSKEKDVYIWISAQDITPNVKADKLITYCHNPMMFYKIDKKELKYSKKLAMFSLLYKYVYKINIKKNTFVVVQQDWIRDAFKKQYKINNIIVAKPIISHKKIKNIKLPGNVTTFIYASQATFFKNFDVLCEASKMLYNEGITEFSVFLTIDGTENAYSRELKKKYSHIPQIKWIGFQKQEKLFKLYAESDCLIFPSQLETWGLPISEYKNTHKPILLADLPYAHETIGNYDKVKFFHPNDSIQLADYMKQFISGTLELDVEKPKIIRHPVVENWQEFWNFLDEC